MLLETGWRQIRRQPTVAGLVVFTIATVIAVNTAIFSLAAPDRIVHLEVDYREISLQPQPEFGRRILAIEERVREADFFAPAARAAIQPPYDPVSEVVSDWGIRPALVSPEFTELFGIRPTLGRVFTEDDTKAKPRAVLIAHELWRIRFGADPDIVGKTLDLPGLTQSAQWRVAGVLPEGFSFPAGANLWIAVPRESGPRPYVPNYARLGHGVTVEQATAALPDVRVTPLADHMRPRGAEALVYLLGAGGLLLLIAQRSPLHDPERGIGVYRRIALGLAVGLAGGRIMQSQLYGVPAASWPVIGCVSVFLLMCCWLSAYWPAAYATRVDPAVALREP